MIKQEVPACTTTKKRKKMQPSNAAKALLELCVQQKSEVSKEEKQDEQDIGVSFTAAPAKKSKITAPVPSSTSPTFEYKDWKNWQEIRALPVASLSRDDIHLAIGKLIRQSKPRPKKHRRNVYELDVLERWDCPNGCGKSYRKNSTMSIKKHKCSKSEITHWKGSRKMENPTTNPNLTFTPVTTTIATKLETSPTTKINTTNINSTTATATVTTAAPCLTDIATTSSTVTATSLTPVKNMVMHVKNENRPYASSSHAFLATRATEFLNGQMPARACPQQLYAPCPVQVIPHMSHTLSLRYVDMMPITMVPMNQLDQIYKMPGLEPVPGSTARIVPISIPVPLHTSQRQQLLYKGNGRGP